jgi:hypothetical protein
MKAAIYDNSGNKIAETNEISIPTDSQSQSRTFTFASPPTLTASTQYILVVWSQAGSGGSAEIRYSSTTGGNGRTFAQAYGSWPSSVSFVNDAYQYIISCNYHYYPSFQAKAAIYSADGSTLIASTQEQTLSNVDGWVTFNFASSPALSATQYVLALYGSDNNVDTYYDTGAIQYFRANVNYPTWPSTMTDQGSSRSYSIYCTYSIP